MTATVLSRRALNRALLARQHLLTRAAMSPASMIEHLVGMQSQAPQQPYLALWSRLDGFDPAELERLMLDREAVRIPGIRTTIHLHTTADAIRIRPVVAAVHSKVFWTTPFGRAVRGLDLEALLAAGREIVESEPHSTAALGARLRERWPDRDGLSMAQAVHYLMPVLQPTPRGLWTKTGKATWTTVEAWLGRPLGAPLPVDELVLRYLAAFGPATVADARTWSWLTGLREVVERLRPRLVTFRDERGRELFDLPGAPRPPEETPAPVRFLPEYDNIALSHDDRSRIFAPEAAGRVTGFVGMFTIDGFIAGQWRIDTKRREAILVLDPFVALTDAQREELVAEAARLATFATRTAADPAITFGIAREPEPGYGGVRTGPARGR